MHNELRYQAKIHAIYEKAIKRKNKIPHLLPQAFFFFFILKNKTAKQQGHAYVK